MNTHARHGSFLFEDRDELWVSLHIDCPEWIMPYATALLLFD